MGRQAYLIQLALGRSAFEEPERTEDGEFILGPHAHDFDNLAGGYRQQFDERGRPINPAAAAAANALRDAQNDVLATVGVVKKKYKQKSKRKKIANQEIVAMIVKENSYGDWVGLLDTGAMLASTWWIVSLRRRAQTFISFSGIPLLEISRSEVRHLGISGFLLSGLLGWVLTEPFEIARGFVLDVGPEVILQFFTSGRHTAASLERYNVGARMLYHVLDTAILAGMAPLLFFSDLQTLHLIPLTARPSLRSLIPFTRESPIRLPPLPNLTSLTSVVQFGAALLASPIFLGWCFGYIRPMVYRFSFSAMRAITPTPDMPDWMSKEAAKRTQDNESTIAGLGDINSRGEQFDEYRGLISSGVRSFSTWCQYVLSRVKPHRPRPMTAALESRIRARAQLLLGEAMVKEESEDRESWSFEAQQRRTQLLRAAVREAWECQGLTPPENLDFWFTDSGLRFPASSTPYPDSERLFDLDDSFIRAAEPASERPEPEPIAITEESYIQEVEPWAVAMIQGINASSIDLRRNEQSQRDILRLQEETSSQHQDEVRHDGDQPESTATPSPLPEEDLNASATGEDLPEPTAPSPRLDEDPDINLFHEAPSDDEFPPLPMSAEVQSDNSGDTFPSAHYGPDHRSEPEPIDLTTSPLQRARRLTEDDGHNGWGLPGEGDDNGWATANLPLASLSASWRAPIALRPGPRHRVTTLSNFPADAFASHASSILTSVVMLPLESCYLRALASGYLDAGNGGGVVELRGDVRAICGLLGGPGGGWRGKMRYVGVMVLLLGLQGVISAGVWGVGTSVAEWIGRRFGWCGPRKTRLRTEGGGWLDLED